MPEELNPEAQANADWTAAMHQAMDEREAAAKETLHKRAAEIVKELAKQRAKDAKEAKG
jgi:hypothetical protein